MSKVSLSRQDALIMRNLICDHFAIGLCSVTLKIGMKSGVYYSDKKAINYGNEFIAGGKDCFIHEMAHHVTTELWSADENHGGRYHMVLTEIVHLVYPDNIFSYSWFHEYKTINYPAYLRDNAKAAARWHSSFDAVSLDDLL